MNEVCVYIGPQDISHPLSSSHANELKFIHIMSEYLLLMVIYAPSDYIKSHNCTEGEQGWGGGMVSSASPGFQIT